MSETRWCAFPDRQCPLGDRWGVSVGDGLAGMCVISPDVDAGGPDASIDASVDAMVDASLFPPDATVDASPLPPDANVDASPLPPDANVDAAPLPIDAAMPDAALAAGSVEFVAQVSSSGKVVPLQVAIADDGQRVAIGGYYTGELTIGTQVAGNAGSDDMFVAMFATGNPDPLWVKTYGSTGSDRVLAIALGSGGDLYFTGRTGATLSIGAIPLQNNGDSDVVVARLAADTGSPVWATSFGGPNYDESFGIGVDVLGNVVVAGYFKLDLNIDGTVYTAVSSDTFVARLSAEDGVIQWFKQFSSTGPDVALHLALDQAGAVVITGYYEGTMTFDTIELTTAGEQDLFVARLNGGTGEPMWARSYGGAGSDRGWRIATSTNDNRIAVVGRFTGTALIGANNYTAGGGQDVFALVLGRTGNPIWSAQLDTDPGEWFGHAVAMDDTGRALITGRYSSGTVIGGGIVTAQGGTDMFVARYSPSGAFEFSEHFGGPGADSGLSVDTAADGTIAAFGYFNGTVQFGGSELTAAGTDRDAVLLLLSP